MGKLSGHGIVHHGLLAASAAPSILVGDPARQYRPIRCQALAGHLKPEFIEPAKSGQVSAGEARTTSNVMHVGVFRRWFGVGTSIIERPRPLPGQRRADTLHTLNCEEPVKVADAGPPLFDPHHPTLSREAFLFDTPIRPRCNKRTNRPGNRASQQTSTAADQRNRDF
jgi:hypothetical protein